MGPNPQDRMGQGGKGQQVIGMGGWPGDVSEEPVTQEKRKKGWRMSCDVGEATDWLENDL